MKSYRMLSIIAIVLLLMQSFGINPNVHVSAKANEDSNKLEVKHVATDNEEGEVTWQVNINPSKSANDGFDTGVLFDSGMTHKDIDYPDNVTVKKENDGYSIETPESEDTYEIKVVTKVTNEKQSQFELQATAKEGNETYVAKEKVEVEVKEEETKEEQKPKEKKVEKTEQPEEEPKGKVEKKSTEKPEEDSNKKAKNNEPIVKKEEKSKKKQENESTNKTEKESEGKEDHVPLEQYDDVKQQKAMSFNPVQRQTMKLTNNEQPTATHKIEKITSDNICIREVEGTVDFTLPTPEEKKPVDIVVIQDASGSYAGNEANAKNSLKALVNMLDFSPDQDRMMVTSYRGHLGWEYDSRDWLGRPSRATNDNGSGVKTVNHSNQWGNNGLINNKNRLNSSIDNIIFDGGTPTASGLQYALSQYQSATQGENLSDRETIFVLVTDGVANVRLDGRVHLNGSVIDEKYQQYEGTFAEVVSEANSIKSNDYKIFSAYWENKDSIVDTYGEGYYNDTIGPAARDMVQNAASSTSYYSSSENLHTVMNQLLDNLQSTLNQYNGFETSFDIAPGFELVEDSVKLNGTQVTPTISGNKVTIKANEIPAGDNKITYQLRETAVHVDETAPVTNGKINYDKEGNTFKGSVTFPNVTLKGNKNSDRCEVNVDKWVAFADSDDFTNSIDLEEESDAFTYKLAYQFDEGVSQYDTIQLKDELEAVLQLIGDENDITVESNDIQNLPYQVNLLADQGGFTLDVEKRNGSYDYLAGNTITVYFQAKIKDGVTQAELNDYQDQLIPNETSLLLDGDPTTSEEVFVKPPSKGKIKLIKVDETNGERLEGATFKVKDTSGNTVDTLVTDDNGEATSQLLPIGSYTLEEVEAPEGYELAAGQTFEVSVQADKTTSITVTNKLLEGTIKLIKKDADDGSKLAEAKFAVKDENGETVSILTTDDNGEAVSKSLPIGKYTLEEIEAPYGYELSADQDLQVTVKANKEVTIIVTNKQLKGSIKIIKVDEKDNQVRLPGAEFELTDEEGNTWTGTTNDNGEYVFDDLTVGKYELTETKAPEDYRLLKKPIEVEVKPDDLTITETIENSKQGWEIPSTGGIGTLGFYSIGLIIMTITGFILFRRRQV